MDYPDASGLRIFRLRLDRAGVNTIPESQAHALENGMLGYSSPYGRHYNGAAERLIQELWNTARTLLFATELPSSWWAEAISRRTGFGTDYRAVASKSKSRAVASTEKNLKSQPCLSLEQSDRLSTDHIQPQTISFCQEQIADSSSVWTVTPPCTASSLPQRTFLKPDPILPSRQTLVHK